MSLSHTSFAVFLFIYAVFAAPVYLNTTGYSTVLMVGAHPDDIEACSGGLANQLLANGVEVWFLIVTNGDKGCSNPVCKSWTSPDIAYAREQEARAAAAVLGIPAARVLMLDYEDAMLTSYPEQQPRRDIIEAIRMIKPTAVFSWVGQPNYKLLPSQGWGDMGYHPDHMATGRLVLDSVFDANVAPLWPEAGDAWPVAEFYMWDFTDAATHYINLSEADLAAKTNAELQHKTQYSDANGLIEGMKMMASTVCKNIGVNGCTYSEAFVAYF